MNVPNGDDSKRGNPSLSTREKWNDENAMNMEGRIYFSFLEYCHEISLRWPFSKTEQLYKTNSFVLLERIGQTDRLKFCKKSLFNLNTERISRNKVSNTVWEIDLSLCKGM